MGAMVRALGLFSVLAIGCGAAARTEPAPLSSTPADEPDTAPPNTDNRCEPLPNEGARCGKRDGYCVLSWGQPGGSSAALWCRDGRWTLEEERNLPPKGMRWWPKSRADATSSPNTLAADE